MKAILNENWFEVEYNGQKGFVLVGDEEIKEPCYILILGNVVNFKLMLAIRDVISKGAKKIIGSTFPLEGVYLIVLEDEAKIRSQEYAINEPDPTLKLISQYSYRDGYNQAKSKYKYTEKQVRQLVTSVTEFISHHEFDEWFERKLNKLNQPKEITEIKFETEDSFKLSEGKTFLETNYHTN